MNQAGLDWYPGLQLLTAEERASVLKDTEQESVQSML